MVVSDFGPGQWVMWIDTVFFVRFSDPFESGFSFKIYIRMGLYNLF